MASHRLRLAIVFEPTHEHALAWHLVRAAEALGLDVTRYDIRRAAAIPAAHDLYLRVDYGDYGQGELPEPLHPRLFYAIDTHLAHSWPKIQRIAPHYDLVCCAQRRAAEALPNGAWVALGFDPDAHGARPLPLRWDVACVGTEGGIPRKFYLQALRERYPNSLIGCAPARELGAIYSQARIGFNYAIRDDVNMRVFETLAAGTLLVTNRLPHDDLARLGLEEGTHYVAYGRPGELMPGIDRYLADESARRRIAQAGHRHVLAGHSYAHRLQQMLALATERLGVPTATTPPEVPSCTCS
jgi:hypothetical protein